MARVLPLNAALLTGAQLRSARRLEGELDRWGGGTDPKPCLGSSQEICGLVVSDGGWGSLPRLRTSGSPWLPHLTAVSLKRQGVCGWRVNQKLCSEGRILWAENWSLRNHTTHLSNSPLLFPFQAVGQAAKGLQGALVSTGSLRDAICIPLE